MKKDLTELVFVLDMSGSMSDLTEDTIGGFNSMIKSRRESGQDVLVTTYVFDSHWTMIHDRLPIAEVPELTEKDYFPCGSTALLDCLGEAIQHTVSVHRYIREEDIPENTVFLITTDGMENASRHYGIEEIRSRISHEKEKYHWEFLFLASNIDAIGTARNYGIDEDHAFQMGWSKESTVNVYAHANEYVGSVSRDESKRACARQVMRSKLACDLRKDETIKKQKEKK